MEIIQNHVSDFSTVYTWAYNKVRELILEGLFVMNLYQLDKQSTKFTIWKY